MSLLTILRNQQLNTDGRTPINKVENHNSWQWKRNMSVNGLQFQETEMWSIQKPRTF